MTRRLFTPREANELLPFIRDDLSRLQEAKRDFVQKALALRELRLQHEQVAKEPPEDQLFELEAGMEFLQMEAKTLADSIRLKGAELKDVDNGLVDFPSLIEGEEVLLCWRLGEERIEYYHGHQEGFQGRRPLPKEEL
ncbi:DUF2203 domain-containing protein [Paenibacillus sp. TRM 82003]|nr:DUF2203 domain-containing protein [Paenibacillus sp. TRM 82003]